MTFSNPAGAAAGAAVGYIRALLDLLGDQDPLEVLSSTVAWLERRTAGVPDALLRRPEAPGRWSAVAVVQHLADSDLVTGWRCRHILCADRPAIQGYDQDAWAERLRYAEADLTNALHQLRGLRDANLRLWRSLSPAELAREGLHSERGPESVDRLMRLAAGHDLVHRRQISRVLAAAGAPGA